MFHSRRLTAAAPGRTFPARGSSRPAFGLAAIAAGGALMLASVALAGRLAPTLSSARNTTLAETIVVDSQGRTLYALSPETTHHLLCRSSKCLAVWQPVSVRSRAVTPKAGPGIGGQLALLRRGDGELQVTLRGMPLYTFVGDSARGQANGEGIKSFGGTWHAVSATASHTMAPTPAPMPEPTPGY